MHVPKLLILVITCTLVTCKKDNFTPLDVLFIDDYRNLASNINNDFQFDLFKEVIRQSEKGSNQIISPISISMALGMLYHGAKGETREEINTLLGYGVMDEPDVLSYQRSQIEYLQGLDRDATFAINNALYYDPDRVKTKQDFLDINAEHNHAFTKALNFDLSTTIEKVNDWVGNATNGKIEKLIEFIDERDVMLILNALYFEGVWNKPFDRKKTRKTSFHLSNNEDIDVDMMFTEDVQSGFLGENMQAFELALGNKDFTVTFVLPNGDIDEWIDQMDPASFSTLFDQLYFGNFLVGLPKFEISSKHALKEVLQSLGMDTAFRPLADFSDLGAGPKGEKVLLARADHATYLKMDEKGVKAAAGTSLTPIVVSERQPILLDRPFVFIFRDRTTDQVLFIGKVENPNLHV